MSSHAMRAVGPLAVAGRSGSTTSSGRFQAQLRSPVTNAGFPAQTASSKQLLEIVTTPPGPKRAGSNVSGSQRPPGISSRENSREGESRDSGGGGSAARRGSTASTDLKLILPDAIPRQERNLSLWDQASWRDKIYAVADPGSFPSDIPERTEVLGYMSAAFMFVMIMVNCASVMGETYPEYQLKALPLYWVAIEICCVVFFTIDLAVRFVTCPSRWGFMKDPLNWIDIVAVAPFYIDMFAGYTFAPWLRMLRVIRLARIVRVLKTANVMGLDAVLIAISSSVSGMLLFIAISGTGLLIFATCIYFAERGEFISGVWWRPCLRYELHCAANGMREPSPFQSIPDAFWYTIVTMGTVGFGDVSPKTGVGQFVGVFVMLSGVFVIAFPTMILSGHYDAAAKATRVVRRTFEQIRDRYVENKGESTRTRLHTKMGWLPNSGAATAGGGAENASKSRIFGDMKAMVTSAISFVASPIEDLRKRVTNGGSNNVENNSIISPPGSAGVTSAAVAPKPAGPPAASTVVALFTFRGVPRELRYSLADRSFYYEPLFHLLRDDDGFPFVRVIYGKCGLPTVVQLTLVLDHHEARNMATNLAVGAGTMQSVVRADVGGGFVVRHHSPFEFDDAAGDDGEGGGNGDGGGPKYTMLAAKARAGYRGVDFPIYFERRRSPHEAHLMAPEESYLSPDAIRKEALAELLGSSLFIQSLLAGRSAKKRATVVTQYFQNTRLHRELELIAMNGDDDVGEATAFVTRDDLHRLLKGVHKKVDLFNHDLCLDHVGKVDHDIAETLLSRLRSMKVVLVPPRLRNCIYNGDILAPDDEVFEVPISLFEADIDDEVEEDSLGYIEVMATPFLGRCLRVDISLDALVSDSI